MQKLLDAFSNPDSRYRGKPFWAWNGKLEPGELRRQLRVMKQMGLGGAFMHSRIGLATPYLSEEWFDCIRTCIDECKTLGMEAWLYDEDRWPSGAAGGFVTKNPKYRSRRLVLIQHDDPGAFHWGPTTLAAFSAQVRDSRAANLKRLNRKTRADRIAAGAAVLEFRDEMMRGSSWHNGYTYLDTLNDEAVREFIRVTHEAYRREIGEEFGKTVPGIFTDEPNYGHPFNGFDHYVPSRPWTGRFRKVFRARYGYDIVAHLPEIFFDIEGREFPKARYHFFDCATHLFVDAFSRQLGEWCERNQLALTGHVLCEDTLSSQTGVSGSAMRFYEHMQAPGIDLLTEKWRVYDAAKQVSSVARQLDRTWRLTETYGCTGWDFPFAGHKALGDWQVALGINLRCQHLSWYTMAGEAKRDYPAGIFDHSPWWQAYSKVEDYFARILSVMTRGREVRDLLVIHPLESMWARYSLKTEKAPGVQAGNRMLVDLRDSLLQHQVDFDYGDEELMRRHASVRRTKEGPRLRVGKADYATVLVPPLDTIRETTLALLERFRAAGGQVVFAGTPPRFVDGDRTDRAATFAAGGDRAPARGAELAAAVAGCRRVAIEDEDGKPIPAALYLLRHDRENAYLFVCNTGHSEAQFRLPQQDDALVRDRVQAWERVRLRGFEGFAGPPLELDPDTGGIFAADAAPAAGGGWTIATSLPALGSRLFVVPRRTPRACPPRRPALRTVATRTLSGAWTCELTEPNVFLLDHAALQIGAGRWQSPRHILKADFAIRDALGIPRRGGHMVQPWARDQATEAPATRVALRYTFDVRQRPAGPIDLAIEQPHRWRIVLNGIPVDASTDRGWWVDQSCRTLPLSPAMLAEGANVLELSCAYNADGPDLEHIYLLGPFGVALQQHHPVMTAPPSRLRCGDWVRQGLAFYSGSVIYRRRVKTPALRKGQRLVLAIPAYRGSVIRIWCGAREAGLVAWEPNEVDVTDGVQDGRLDLGIEVIAHRRNSHGPLQLKDRWPAWHGPNSFPVEHKRTPRYYTVPCGLMQAPRLTVRALA